jgi:hypothetical protein
MRMRRRSHIFSRSAAVFWALCSRGFGDQASRLKLDAAGVRWIDTKDGLPLSEEWEHIVEDVGAGR